MSTGRFDVRLALSMKTVVLALDCAPVLIHPPNPASREATMKNRFAVCLLKDFLVGFPMCWSGSLHVLS